jgi:hypothetical protein
MKMVVQSFDLRVGSHHVEQGDVLRWLFAVQTKIGRSRIDGAKYSSWCDVAPNSYLETSRMKKRFSLVRVVSTIVVAGVTLGLAAVPSGASNNRFHVSKGGFSFALPAKWLHVPLDGTDINGILKSASKNNPQLKSALTKEVVEAAKKGISFFAFGPIANGFASNVNIIVTTAGGAPSGPVFFADVEAQLKVQLVSAGFKHLKTSIRQLPMGIGVYDTYQLSAGVGKAPVHGLQLYLRHKDKVEIITFTSTTEKSDTAAATVLENSWKWS